MASALLSALISFSVMAAVLTYFYTHKEETIQRMTTLVPKILPYITPYLDQLNLNQGEEQMASKNHRSEEVLGQLIKTDFTNLIQKDYLDKNLLNVAKIWYSIRTPEIDSSIQKNENFLTVKDDGLYFVTAEIYDFPDDQFQAYLVQYNWVNSKNGNKDWEMNRVYKLKKKVALAKPNKPKAK